MTTTLMDINEAGLEIKLEQYMKHGCWAKAGHTLRYIDRHGVPRYVQELIYTGEQ